MNSSRHSIEDSESQGSFFERLCQFCETMLQEDPESVDDARGPVKPTHHVNLASLQSAAVNGCFICHSLWTRLARNYNLNDPRFQDRESVAYELRPSIYEAEEFKPPSLVLWMEIKDHDKPMMTHNRTQYIGCHLEFNLASVTTDIATELWPHLEGAETTMNRVSLDRATQWLNTCRTSHELCNAKSTAIDPSWQPTRLLFLECTPSSPRVRLTLPEDRGGSVQYVTLIHQWGTAKFLKLTSDKFDTMRLLGIPFEDLSQTFQDAIVACLALGFQYIWIDSLCIIQDSEADWLKEASMMQMAYQNSAFTISATGRDTMVKGLGSLRHLGCTTQNAITSLGTDIRRCLIYDRDFWNTYVLQAPLMERGWVLQERLLSPRILHFVQGQLAWECNTLETCELYEAVPPMHIAKSSKYVTRAPRRDMRPTMQTDRDFSVHREKWQNVVETYSKCKLTQQFDKLIALGGIAALFNHHANDQYIAGLWRSHLVRDLTWDIFRTFRGRRMQNHEYRAPSWSWASVEGPVNFARWCRFETDRQDLAELVDVTVDLVDPENPFGAVKDGYLILRGIWAKAHYCTNWAATKRDGYLNLEISEWQDFGPGRTRFHPDDLTDIPADIYILALAFVRSSRLRFYGLVIAKDVNRRTEAHGSCFRRVGICSACTDVKLNRQKMQQTPRELIMLI